MIPSMRIIFVTVFITGAMLCLVSFNKKRHVRIDTPAVGFTLVELFTSEGCSSCPSADNLVARIARETNGKPVYILAYHVDYWNRLGWKDPFSSSEWSQRQSQYSSWLKLRGVYTPQIVVNGKTEFVGSDETRLRKAMSLNGTAPLGALQIKINKTGADKAELTYSYTGKTTNPLFIACVQRSGVTKVAGGENGGRTLSHVNIVRSLQRFSPGAGENISVTLPRGFDPRTWEMIGFIQNTATGEVLGAASATMGAI